MQDLEETIYAVAFCFGSICIPMVGEIIFGSEDYLLPVIICATTSVVLFLAGSLIGKRK